jgi:DNA-binding NarL/FixJ family response regulator
VSRPERGEIEQILRDAGFALSADSRLDADAQLGTVTEAFRITSGELRLLEAAARYDGSKEIARALGLRLKTVNVGIQRLMDKLEVHSRARLIARAFVLGLLRIERLIEVEPSQRVFRRPPGM